MVILRRTNRLGTQLPESLGGDVGPSDTALGDWYANRVVVRRTPLILLVSSRGLLPLVIRARDVSTLPARLPELVRRRLYRLPLLPRLADAEVAAMSPVAVRKTADRAVVRILVEFARSLPHYLPIGQPGDRDLAAAENMLEETPCFTSSSLHEVVFPRVKTVELLRERWSAT